MTTDKDTALDVHEVLLIRELALSGFSLSDISRKTCVSVSHIYRITIQEAWPDGPFPDARQCFGTSGSAMRDIAVVKAHYRRLWRDRSDLYWAWRLIQEVVEVLFACIGLSSAGLYWELVRVGSIAANWLDLILERENESGPIDH